MWGRSANQRSGNERATIMMFRKTRGITAAVTITFGLSQLGIPGVMGQEQGHPFGSSPDATGTAQATTTTMVPQDQVVYETVYDTRYVQVPTTQMRPSTKQSTRRGACRLRGL